MNKQEGREILLVMAESLRTAPPSFTYNVNVGDITGTSVVMHGPGTGIAVNQNVSGPVDGEVVGYDASITISGLGDLERATLDAELLKHVARAVELLQLIAAEAEKAKPDASRLRSLIGQIPSQVVGAVVADAVTQIVRTMCGY